MSHVAYVYAVACFLPPWWRRWFVRNRVESKWNS